jgi:type IV pilus biogenesis protein PilP
MNHNSYKLLIFLLAVSISMHFVSYASAQELLDLDEDSLMSFEALEDNFDVLNADNDPCPAVSESLRKRSPDNLRLIQEDIMRYDLCVRRAQLLDRLNDLTSENMNLIESSIDAKIEEVIETTELNTDMLFPNNSQTNISETLPQLSVPELRINSNEQLQWAVDQISGQAGDLEAKIIDRSGNIFYVKKGDTLPNSDSVVTDIKNDGVSIKGQDGQVISLAWKIE